MQSSPGRSHSACQNADSEFVPFLRLIDCEARQIIEGASNCEYLALSYIWGSARNLPFNPPTTDACYPLPDNIPETIEDAVVATRKLGYRFLWVDRYCIHQCDEDDMQKQLNSMDLIYTNATATLIAVAGTDPSSGLPGVSSTFRTRQAVVECGNTELVSSLRDPAKTIRASKWASRGWTYQEAVFSRRRLVFTEQQVYFECNSMHCCESIHIPPSLLSAELQNNLELRTQHARVFGGGAASSSLGIEHRIVEYSKKTLTHQYDALNGCLGIFRAFERSKIPVYQSWGIPFGPSQQGRETDLDAGFINCLRWRLLKPVKRRAGFPSWSWTGWSGQLADMPRPRIGSDSETFDIYLRMELENGKKIMLGDYMKAAESRALIPQLSQYIHMGTWAIKFRFVETGECVNKAPGLWARFWVGGLIPTGTWQKNTFWAFVRPTFCCKVEEDKELLRKLREDVWDGVLLADLNRSARFLGSFFIMIIDRHGETAQRIGHVDLGGDVWLDDSHTFENRDHALPISYHPVHSQWKSWIRREASTRLLFRLG
jgi:hypothetical protein